MDADKILDKARSSIGKFCIEECRSYCCRKGYLVLREEEVDIVLNNKGDEYRDALKKIDEDKYSLFMGGSNKACPALSDNYMCSIHKNEKRPLVCKEFPIFIKGKKLLVSKRCLAVKMNMLYPYISQLIALGYELERTEMPIGYELYDSLKALEYSSEVG